MAIPETVNGTSVTTSAIVDATGNIWTLVNSMSSGLQVAMNGVVDTKTSNVIQLVYQNHLVYQENSAKNWWSFQSGAWVSTSNPTSPVITPVSSVGPSVSGSFVNVDLTNLTGQTISRYVWGVSTSSLGNNLFSACSDSTLQGVLGKLAYPLYRFNPSPGYTEAAFPNGAATSSNMAAVFGPLINNAPHFIPANARIIIGLGNNPSTWNSASAYAAMCKSVATYFHTTNSTATGKPLSIYGFEIGNEDDGGSGNPPSYYYSYFNAASAAIRGVNSSYNVMGPVFSYVSDVSGFLSNCGSNCQVLDYHYYMYGGQSDFTSKGGVSAVLTDNNGSFGSAVSGAVSGNTPIFMGEYNQNDTWGTVGGNSAGSGSCNEYQVNNIGAVFNAQCILSGLNASHNFEMAGIWEVYQDSDYGLVGATDVAGGGQYTVSPGGYFLSKAASTIYGPRANVTVAGNLPINCIAVSGGPGANNFAIMMINYSQTAAATGAVAISNWPVNTTGTGSINQWVVSAANPNGITTSLAVAGGMTNPVTIPAASVMILYV